MDAALITDVDVEGLFPKLLQTEPRNCLMAVLRELLMTISDRRYCLRQLLSVGIGNVSSLAYLARTSVVQTRNREWKIFNCDGSQLIVMKYTAVFYF